MHRSTSQSTNPCSNTRAGSRAGSAVGGSSLFASKKLHASLKELTVGFMPPPSAPVDGDEYVAALDTWRKGLVAARVEVVSQRREAILAEFRGY